SPSFPSPRPSPASRPAAGRAPRARPAAPRPELPPQPEPAPRPEPPPAPRAARPGSAPRPRAPPAPAPGPARRRPVAARRPSLRLHRLRLLGGVGMIRAGVHLELRQLAPRKAVAREHPPHCLADHLLGMALEHVAEPALAQAPRIAAVAAVDLVAKLVAGHAHLLGVDDDDEIAGVNVRCVLRRRLRTQRVRDLGRQASEGLALGIDDEPVALAALGCCDKGLHDENRAKPRAARTDDDTGSGRLARGYTARPK